MKLERRCETCYHNLRGCTQPALCENRESLNPSRWKPYTNAEHIRNMTNAELADYIMRAKGTVYKLICDDYHDGCWWDCKTNHHCNADAFTCAPDKEDVMRWLRSEVKVDEDM